MFKNITITAIFSLVTLHSAGAALAQTASPGCFLEPARLSDTEIASFLATPPKILQDFPQGGLGLASQVRSLIGSSSDTMQPILDLAPGASDDQRSAIGAGLARAARACAPTNPEYASQIQERVAELNDPMILAAFAGASNDTQTAALGASASGGGAAAGIGAGGVAGGGAAGADGSAATVSASGTFGVSRGSRYFSNSVTVSAVSPN